MTPVFVDTSFFVALLDQGDEFHEEAVHFLLHNTSPLLSTSAIVLELGAYFAQQQLRPGFLASLDAINNTRIKIVHVDQASLERAIEYFETRPDKDWSLADRVSFLLMEDRQISETATSDRHFEQAGFIALLRTLHKTN